MPKACINCPNISKCIDQRACVVEKRHVIDAVVTVHVTEHQKYSFRKCPFHEGQILQGEFPVGVSATVQYGDNLNALAVALNTVGMVSLKRTHEILGSVFSIPLSTGTISSMVRKCAESVNNTVNIIRQKVINSTIGHFDETGTRVDGKTMWVHNSSTEDYTYLSVHQKRGTEGMDDNGVLPAFQGIAMHDCWKSYWKYGVMHAVCCAHLLRELTGIEENDPNQKWATKFKELLLKMKKVKDKASCPPIVGRNRTKPCSFSGIHTLFSNNLMCVRRFVVDNCTLFPYNIMCDCQSEVRSMNAKEKIEELLEASEDGTITAAQVTEAGLHRSVLQEFVKSGEMYRFGRGLYVRSSAWEDDFYLLQRKYGRGIYSHDTALYLLGYSDRTPAKYTMTFPKGYNAPSLKQENLIIKRVVPENYEFGQTQIESPSGNPIRVYDLERTLCDILRGSGSDVQIVGEAMKRYAASKDKNIHKLMQYADQLRVKPKVLRYMEVLL